MKNLKDKQEIADLYDQLLFKLSLFGKMSEETKLIRESKKLFVEKINK